MSALKNGALYIRVSTADQTELSPDAQQRLLLDYAKKNGIVIAKEFIFEESVSGRHADRRPKFQEMIALAKQDSHPIDVILVWKYSRFARNQEESIVYKSLLKKNNIDVISISEPLIDGPFGTLIERIIEWMDEYYSIRLSGEVLRGMKEKALQHGYQTTPCLGYQAAGGGKPFVIDEAEYQIVKYIMDQYDLEHLDPTRSPANAMILDTAPDAEISWSAARSNVYCVILSTLVLWSGMGSLSMAHTRRGWIRHAIRIVSSAWMPADALLRAATHQPAATGSPVS